MLFVTQIIYSIPNNNFRCPEGVKEHAVTPGTLRSPPPPRERQRDCHNLRNVKEPADTPENVKELATNPENVKDHAGTPENVKEIATNPENVKDHATNSLKTPKD